MSDFPVSSNIFHIFIIPGFHNIQVIFDIFDSFEISDSCSILVSLNLFFANFDTSDIINTLDILNSPDILHSPVYSGLVNIPEVVYLQLRLFSIIGFGNIISAFIKQYCLPDTFKASL